MPTERHVSRRKDLLGYGRTAALEAYILAVARRLRRGFRVAEVTDQVVAEDWYRASARARAEPAEGPWCKLSQSQLARGVRRAANLLMPLRLSLERRGEKRFMKRVKCRQ